MFDRVAHAAHIVAKKLLRAAPPRLAPSRVRVRLVLDTETKKVSLECSVRSSARSSPFRGDLWGHKNLSADETPEKLLYLAAQAAEQIANFQNGAYGDKHNPPAIANAMQWAVKDILKQADRASTRPDVSESANDKGFGNG